MLRAIDDIDGFEFYVYPDDHPPAHVHVYVPGRQARVALVSLKVLKGADMKKRHEKKALKLIKINIEELKKAWNKHNEEQQI
jgi:hypothetical protein